MEREGEGRGVRGRREGEREKMRRGRRRGGGEKMRGIIVGGMALLLVLGCNNGGEDPQKVFLKSVVSLGNEFLNVFTSFGDVFSSSLGFKKDLKKSDVREYFDKVKKTVEGTRDKLNAMVENMRKEGNPNASTVKTKVEELMNNKLSKIIEGANTASGAIGDTGTEILGNVADNDAGGAAGKNVEELVKGIKSIVDVVLSEKEGTADAGDDKKADDLGNRTARTAGNGEAGKLFNNAGINSNNPKKAAADAAKAVGAVTGADILKAMANNSDSEKLAKNNDGNVETAPKDATIAGGVALRAMAKGGKFANGSTNASDVVNAVKGAATSAVTKALDTLTIAIRKTIDEGLKKVKDAMNLNANDMPVTTTEAKN